MNSAKDALSAFGSSIGLPDIKFNDDKICALIVGDDLEVWFEDTGNNANMRLNCIVRENVVSDASVLSQLMKANYNGEGTGCAALALNPITSELVLSQGIDVIAESEDSFKEKVDLFVKYAAFWSDEAPKMLPVVDEAPSLDEGFMRV